MLLIDEVLAVGDAAFQQKCLDAFYRLREDGRTIVLVSHDMPMIERFCHRALLLEDGRVELEGEPRAVGRRYLELNFERPATARGAGHSEDAGATIAGVWIEDDDGRRIDAIAHGERFHIHALVDVAERLERPNVHVSLTTDDAVHVFGARTQEVEAAAAPFEVGERVAVRVSVENALNAGRYYVDLSVHARARGTVSYWGRACDFLVFGSREGAGLVTLDHTVTVEREIVHAAR
jgi:ABC-type molybdate transport system ATPase subunit